MLRKIRYYAVSRHKSPEVRGTSKEPKRETGETEIQNLRRGGERLTPF